MQPLAALLLLLLQPPGGGREALAARVRELASSTPATLSFYAKNLDTGAEFGVRPDERVRTASTIKLPIMAAVFAKVAAAELTWDTPLTLTEADRVSGSGVLREFSPGLKLPLRDVMRMMIVVSDNSATNMIIERIGADYVNQHSAGFGLKNTLSMRKVRGDGNQLKQASGFSKAGLLPENEKYGLGVSTPREMVALLELIATGRLVSPQASAEMLEILKRQQYKDGIGRRLPGLSVASKSGALDRLRSDVGIVFSPGGRIAIAATVDGLPKTDYSAENEGNILIAELAKALVAGLSK